MSSILKRETKNDKSDRALYRLVIWLYFWYYRDLMLKIRLQRIGRRNNPAFRLVATESTRGPKSGDNIEILGSYSPHTDKAEFKAERILHWIKSGAQVSDTVHNLLVREKIVEGEKKNVLPRKSPIVKEKEEEAKTSESGSPEEETNTDEVSSPEEATTADASSSEEASAPAEASKDKPVEEEAKTSEAGSPKEEVKTDEADSPKKEEAPAA